MKEEIVTLLQKSFSNQIKFNNLLYGNSDWAKNDFLFWNRVIYATISEIVSILYKEVSEKSLLQVKDRLMKAWNALLSWILQEEYFFAKRDLKEISHKVIFLYSESKKSLPEEVHLENIFDCIDNIVYACVKLDLYRTVKNYCDLLCLVNLDIKELCEWYNNFTESVLQKFKSKESKTKK